MIPLWCKAGQRLSRSSLAARASSHFDAK